MNTTISSCMINLLDDNYVLEDYQCVVPRWCVGCGDHGVLTAVQRLCRDEKLPPEKTVFVSGIGCSSRFPHYMSTYGFHGLHGRALPIAEGVKIKRPDLNVFVIMGDGDCCSIGTAHWIHAVRYNMNMTAIVLDNGIYGLTKNQASPTSQIGQISNTTPTGSRLEPLNPISVTLGISNASFVAQAADWMPDVTHDIIQQAFRHKGFSFVRILQRCPEFQAHRYDDWVRDPERMLLLKHDNGLHIGPELGRVYRNQELHDPSDRNRAREIASGHDPIPVGILYKNPNIPCYEELQVPDTMNTSEGVSDFLEAEFDKVTINPKGATI
ncbi:thiamine pyrophosphate-dependent enzyme [Photobacterium lipolyticum]|uniref:2-oxoglutarate oxidoreductase n=1 Tax=Photobacterium lipolyticum TaxID=266810 RepID=A0A2T3N512_9GAMM|nr:thiamine pyrophosphate-dependent enzyme [Photobacterium lipolyticum]PSW07520.1 2-oxoglutarate oxidoreductase [Photobacterium lipolyticum]